GVARGGAVPVPLAGGGDDGVAGAHLEDRATPSLDTADALEEVEDLPEGMRVPRAARPRGEVDAVRDQPRGPGADRDRVDPSLPGEAVGRPAEALGPGAGDVHGVSPR